MTSTSHIMIVDPAFFAAARQFADMRRHAGPDISPLLRSDRPLSGTDRQALDEALKWWQEQQAHATQRAQEITARLERG